MSEVAKLEKRIDKRFDDLTALMSEFANDVQIKFDKIDNKLIEHDARFDQQDARFDRIEERLVRLEESHNKLMNTIDGFIKRIDDYETELVARDHKIERLERWIEQIAAKTGVKLT